MEKNVIISKKAGQPVVKSKFLKLTAQGKKKTNSISNKRKITAMTANLKLKGMSASR